MAKKSRLNSTAANHPTTTTTTTKISSHTLPFISGIQSQQTSQALLHLSGGFLRKSSARTESHKATWCVASPPVTTRQTHKELLLQKLKGMTSVLPPSFHRVCEAGLPHRVTANDLVSPPAEKKVIATSSSFYFFQNVIQCSILQNTLLIWLYCFIDPTESRKEMKFKAPGWLDMAPPGCFPSHIYSIDRISLGYTSPHVGGYPGYPVYKYLLGSPPKHCFDCKPTR